MSSILGVFRVIQEEPLNFLMFLAVNLLFGGMAIWLPPAIATHHPVATASHELLVAIGLGHGYFFALALLAAAFSYMVREYRDNTKTEFKDLKLYATTISLILMFVMAVLLTAMTYGGFAPTDRKELVWHPKLMLQVFLTLCALLMSAFLFCLERIDVYPEYGKGLRDRTAKKLRAEMEEQSATGIET
jgi:TRAP-type C4-dicarboxylate transport system permease large subunit